MVYLVVMNVPAGVVTTDVVFNQHAAVCVRVSVWMPGTPMMVVRLNHNELGSSIRDVLAPVLVVKLHPEEASVNWLELEGSSAQ